MKQYSYILLFAFLYILLCSKSCNQAEDANAERERKGVESAMKSITVHFTTDTLSLETLNGFEETAKIKVADLFDYLNILSDQNTAPGFRSQVMRTIPGLFISKDCSLSIDHIRGSKEETIRIVHLVDSISVVPDYLKGLKPDSLWIINNLQAIDDSTYFGKLGFLLRPVASATNTNNGTLLNGTIEYKVFKREKAFGGQSLKVWNVFLGDTRFWPAKSRNK